MPRNNRASAFRRLTSVNIQPLHTNLVRSKGTFPAVMPVVSYDFANGQAANGDGSHEGTIQNAQHQHSIFTDVHWGEVKNTLTFAKKSFISLPSSTNFFSGDAFCIELFAFPQKSTQKRMTLFQGITSPCTVSLTKVKRAFHLTGSVLVKSDDHKTPTWVTITADKPIPSTWGTLSVLFTGDAIVLLQNNVVVGRRVLRNAQIPKMRKVAGTAGNLLIGRAVLSTNNSFVGRLGGFRLWNSVPKRIDPIIEVIEQQGIGEIESKYENLNPTIRRALGSARGTEVKTNGGRHRLYQRGAIYWSPTTGAHAIWGEIYKIFKRTTFSKIGFPLTDELPGEVAGSRVSRFQNGAAFWSSRTKAHVVAGPIFAHYMKLGRERGFLGLPTTGVRTGGNREKQNFQRGSIFHKPGTGTFEVHGAILKHFTKLREGAGILGWPISNEHPVYNSSRREIGKASRFENGTIYFSNKTKAHEVHGEILKAYQAIGGPASKLGFPITDETAVRGSNVRYNEFENGIIVWRPGMTEALVITEIEFFLDTVRQHGRINDGIGDSSADLISSRWVMGRSKQNKRTKKRSINFKSRYLVKKVRANSVVDFTIKLWDWDRVSGNDYLGIISKKYTIKDLWGMTNEGVGIFQNVHMTGKGKDSRNKGSFRFTYRIAVPSDIKITKDNFREKGFWNIKNRGTNRLSKNQYVACFRDVDYVDGWFETALNAWDSIYFEIFKGIAKGGNCFGYSTEAMYAYFNQSLFPNPINRFKETTVKNEVNIKQGYQLGAESIDWTLWNLLNLDAVQPKDVLEDVKKEIRRRGVTGLSCFDLSSGKGHTVLAYDVGPGRAANEAGRIYVADSNLPWFRNKSARAGYVAIYKNNTFRTINWPSSFQSKAHAKGLLPGTLMFHTPYRIVSKQPRTPFYEALALLLATGGLMVFAGEADVEQVNLNGQDYFKNVRGKRHIRTDLRNGFGMIPMADLGPNPPTVFASNRTLPSNIRMDLKGRKSGTLTQIVQSKHSLVQLKAPTGKNIRDNIRLEGAHTPQPLLKLETTQLRRSASVDYVVLLDPKGRDNRKWTVNFDQARGQQVRLQASKRTGSILLENAVPQKPVTITLETVVNNRVKKSVLRNLKVNDVSEVLRVKPRDWNAPTGEVVVERLSSFDGGVLSTKIIKGSNR